jgi:hypothetical protein
MAKSIGSFTFFVMVTGLFLIPTDVLFSDSIMAHSPALFRSNIESGLIIDATGIQNINALRFILPLVQPREATGLSFSTGLYLGLTGPLNQIGLTIPRKYHVTSGILILSHNFLKQRLSIETLFNWAQYSDTSLLFFFPSMNLRGTMLRKIQTEPFSIILSLGLFLGLQYQATTGFGFTTGLSAGLEL